MDGKTRALVTSIGTRQQRAALDMEFTVDEDETHLDSTNSVRRSITDSYLCTDKKTKFGAYKPLDLFKSTEIKEKDKMQVEKESHRKAPSLFAVAERILSPTSIKSFRDALAAFKTTLDSTKVYEWGERSAELALLKQFLTPELSAHLATTFLIGRQAFIIYGHPLMMQRRSSFFLEKIGDRSMTNYTQTKLAPDTEMREHQITTFLFIWAWMNDIISVGENGSPIFDYILRDGRTILDVISTFFSWIQYFKISKQSLIWKLVAHVLIGRLTTYQCNIFTKENIPVLRYLRPLYYTGMAFHNNAIDLHVLFDEDLGDEQLKTINITNSYSLILLANWRYKKYGKMGPILRQLLAKASQRPLDEEHARQLKQALESCRE